MRLRATVLRAFVLLSAACDESSSSMPSPSLAPPAEPRAAPSATARPAAAQLPTADAGLGNEVCGTSLTGDCPLQAWMKAHAAPPAVEGNLPALADVLTELSKLAPEGYTHWAAIARDGAAAATVGDLAAARAACGGCHAQYKRRYRSELRARRL